MGHHGISPTKIENIFHIVQNMIIDKFGQICLFLNFSLKSLIWWNSVSFLEKLKSFFKPIAFGADTYSSDIKIKWSKKPALVVVVKKSCFFAMAENAI